jgi:hypothetical protein
MSTLSKEAQALVDWKLGRPTTDWPALSDEDRREVGRRLDAGRRGSLGSDELMAAEKAMKDRRSDAEKAGDWTDAERIEVEIAFAAYDIDMHALNDAARETQDASRELDRANQSRNVVIDGLYDTIGPDADDQARAQARKRLADAEYKAAFDVVGKTKNAWLATTNRVGSIADGRRLAAWRAENAANQQVVQTGILDSLRSTLGRLTRA